jgi:hypothetical protein
MKPSVVIGSLIALLLALWWGVPTFQKARADALVDELCQKDGGFKIYEVVRLPPARFNEHGNFDVPSIKQKKDSDEFYFTRTQTWIRKGRGDSNELVVWRSQHEIFRSNGTKIAESISYARTGGDPVSYGHPSSYSCPREVGVEKKVFIKE